MKVLFKNKTQYTKDTYAKFLKFHDSKYGFKYMIVTILLVIMLIYCVILTLINKLWLLGITFILSTIIFIAYRFFYPVSQVKKELKGKAISKEKSFTFKFYERSFKVVDKINYSQLPYWKLKKVFETNDFFYLYIDKTHAFLVKKDGFTYGNVNDFSKFIKKKCWYKFTLVNNTETK